MTEPKPLWRDAAGVLMASMVVGAFVAIGFILMFAKMVFDIDLSVDAGWLAAMLSLASAAFGFLIGKKGGARVHGFDRPLCATCPIRDHISSSDDKK